MKKIIQEHYAELEAILDNVRVGIFITDGDGNVLILNKESEKTGGLSKQQLIGRNMKELIAEGYVEESTITKAMENHHENSIIQKLGDGGKVYITGVPMMKNGEVQLVICTERDVTETIELRELLRENREIAVKYKKELETLRSEQQKAEEAIIANSYAMRAIIDRAVRVAQMDTTVLLTGESGTGKELVAKLIYTSSKRSSRPFFRINCAAIPESLLESEFFGYEKGSFTGANSEGKSGIFETINGGTLFLDEVGELPISMQAKLLRVLQEKEVIRIGGTKVIPVDVRIIAATNKNLEKAIQDGQFREDLYYRLNIFPMELPPLRNRKEDIPKLADYFLEQFSREYKVRKKLEEDAYQVLLEYDWPGNIRELRNIIERTLLDSYDTSITRFQVTRQLVNRKNPESGLGIEITGSLQEMVEEYERSLILSLMKRHQKASKVADILHVNKSTISKKLKRYAQNGKK